MIGNLQAVVHVDECCRLGWSPNVSMFEVVPSPFGQICERLEPASEFTAFW